MDLFFSIEHYSQSQALFTPGIMLVSCTGS